MRVDFVDVVGELLDTEHVAMVCQGHGIHAVFEAFVHQVGHFRHTVEDGVMRVDVEMGEVLGNIVARLLDFLTLVLSLFLLVEVARDDDIGRLDRRRIRLTEIHEELLRLRNFRTSQHPNANEFEKHSGSGLHIGGGVVG